MNAGSGFRGRVSIILWLIAALPATAAAQTVVNSEKIDSVAVTLYRDPNRNMGPPNPAWPSGYALAKSPVKNLLVPATDVEYNPAPLRPKSRNFGGPRS